MHSVPWSTPARVGWLLPVGTLFFACGIMLGRIALSPGLLMLLMALGLAAVLLSRRWMRFTAVMLVSLYAGALWGWHALHPALPSEGEYAVTGVIAQEIDLREDGQVQTVLCGVTLNGASAPEAHWTFYLDEDEPLPDWLAPGAYVCMTARAYHPDGQTNPGGFSFREYLLQRGVKIGLYGADDLRLAESEFSLQSSIAALRHRLALRLMDVMGEEAGAYAAAMLLGTRDFIPEDDRAAFNDLGIAHLLSVSGFHAGVLICLLLLLLRPLPVGRKARLALEALLLSFYCLLCGGNAPVVRASGLLLWREFTRIRRKQVLPLHALCVTALLQLIFNPVLLISASFQLTYGAMLGITLVYPRLKDKLSCRTAFGQRLWQGFAVSLSAQLGILPAQLYWFGELPLLGLLLNPLIIPAAGLLISLYWLTLAALPIPGLNALLGTLSAWGTSALLGVIRFLSSVEFTSLWTRQADGFTLLGWALVLLGLSVLLPRRIRKGRKYLCLIGALMIAAILLPLPENTTRYIQFSVGNADAALLQDQDMTVVIDAGEDGQTIAHYLHQRRQSVELLIITHLHIDHGGGIRALIDEGIPIEVCYLPFAAQTPMIDEEVLPLIEELRQGGTEIRYLCRGDVIALPSGQMTVLWPEEGRVFPAHDANDVSLVLQAEIAGVTMLLTGDLTGDYAPYIARPSDILKVAHHGSKVGNTAEFLAAVQPQILLQSNRLLSRTEYMAAVAGDIPLYATEQCGAVIVDFEGGGAFSLSHVLTPGS